MVALGVAGLVAGAVAWAALPDRGAGVTKQRIRAKITGNIEENGNYLIRAVTSLRRPALIPGAWMRGVEAVEGAPATFRVTTPEGLYNALNLAGGEETILLAPGDYGAFGFQKVSYARPGPTVRSEDPENPARFARLKLKLVRNLTLDGIALDFRLAAEEPRWTNALWLLSTRNVAVTNSAIRGADPARGRGVYLDKSDDARIEGNEIAGVQRGVLAIRSSGRVAGNLLRETRNPLTLKKGEVVAEANRTEAGPIAASP